MKRLLALALIVFGLGVFAAQTASPAGDPQGPPCSNITDANRSYSAAGVIDIVVFLQAPACLEAEEGDHGGPVVTYKFFVTETSGAAITPVTATQDAVCTPQTTDEGCVHFVYDLGGNRPAEDVVCIYATTDIHDHLADRAPNVSQPGCPESSPSVTLAKSASGAEGGFN
jgi:hypothetical protein